VHAVEQSPLLVAAEVARATRLAIPTVYELARKDPERWGLVRFGRAVRFRRERILALVRDGQRSSAGAPPASAPECR
jgi:hypothetical protein